MKTLDKLLSYLYPIVIEITSSDTNPILEVVYRDGRYQLNSARTNYSYGGLYELFKLIFRDIHIDWENVNSVLILGFGTGCTVPLIHNYKMDCRIFGVEIDSKVIEFGNKYFNVDQLTNTSVICDNAYNFITTTDQKFDLIIIDVYIDIKVPEELETLHFLQCLKGALNINGIVIFNKLIYNKEIKRQIPIIDGLYRKVFDEVACYSIIQTGTIFVAKNINK